MRKVWIFGDSTSADYGDSPFQYQQSWTYFLKSQLSENIEYENVAVAGKTLKWFNFCTDYQEGKITKNVAKDSLWAKILQKVKSDDLFVFFVGGINDHGQINPDQYRPNPDGDYIIDDYFQIFGNREVFMYVGEGFGTHSFYTIRSTVEEYVEILTDMINAVKTKGAIPLLVRGTGKYYMRKNNNFDVFPTSHEYMAVLPQIAENTNAYYLDVGSVFENGFKTNGYAFMMENYFMSKSAVTRLNKRFGLEKECNYNDNCHHNIDGAKHVYDIFAEQLKNSNYPLKDYLK